MERNNYHESHGGTDKVLTRVRALLAKAESTEFRAEADSFMAKAQELITRHAIDRARLDQAGGPGASEPTARQIRVERPYARAKSALLHQIALANRCRCVLASDSGVVSIFGYRDNLDAVELLFTSLLVQATGAVTAMGPQRDVRGRSRTRSFRQSFFFGFAHQIGHRLRTAAQEVTTVMTGGDDRLLPVLAARDQRVDDAVAAAYPHLTKVSHSLSNHDGYVAGRAAGALASLDPRSRLEHRAS